MLGLSRNSMNRLVRSTREPFGERWRKVPRPGETQGGEKSSIRDLAGMVASKLMSSQHLRVGKGGLRLERCELEVSLGHREKNPESKKMQEKL